MVEIFYSLRKFDSRADWGDHLNIFLYNSLIFNNNQNTTISDYHVFQLTDNLIKSFNEWIDLGAPEKETLTKWKKDNEQEVLHFKNNFLGEFKKKVEIWGDRDKTPYFKDMLQQSFEFELFLEKFFKEKYFIDLCPFLTPEGQYYKGENEAGIEIKCDMLYKKTGNLYIEYEEKARAENINWVNSGIKKKDNTIYFLIGDFNKFWVFRKSRLLQILDEELKFKELKIVSKRKIRFVKIDTSKGFLFPINEAEKEVISLDILVSEIKKNFAP